ncbi:MAG: hypothetical protein QM613_02200, partial [Micrococcaceae bacterium]
SSSSGLVVVTNTVLTSTGISVDYSDDVKNFTITATLDGCDSVTAEQTWIYPNLVSWGNNSAYYPLGTGNSSIQTSPVAIGPYQVWDSVNLRQWQAFAINDSNDLYAWGSNVSGEIGNNSSTPISVPTYIDIGKWLMVSGGAGFTWGIKNDNNAYSWGQNDGGELGGGVDRKSPSVIGTALSPWQQVAAGHGFTYAITGTYGSNTAGALYATGRNGYGQLGSGNTTSRNNIAVRVNSSTNFLQVASGWATAYAITAGQRLFATGNNDYGQIGRGGTVDSQTMVQVGLNTAPNALWQQVSSTYQHAMALTTDNLLYVWGQNSSGQVGDNSTTNRGNPINISLPASAPSGATWNFVAAGASQSYALDSEDNLYSWGSNAQGQLGNGSTTDSLTPTRIGNLKWQTVNSGSGFTAGITYTFVPKGYSY